MLSAEFGSNGGSDEGKNGRSAVWSVLALLEILLLVSHRVNGLRIFILKKGRRQ